MTYHVIPHTLHSSFPEDGLTNYGIGFLVHVHYRTNRFEGDAQDILHYKTLEDDPFAINSWKHTQLTQGSFIFMVI